MPILQIYGGNHLYTPFNPLYQPDGQKAAPQPGTEVPKLIGDPTAHAGWRAFVEALARRYHPHIDPLVRLMFLAGPGDRQVSNHLVDSRLGDLGSWSDTLSLL